MVIRLAAHGSHSWRWPTPSAPVLCRTALPLTRPLPQPSACLASSLFNRTKHLMHAARFGKSAASLEPGPQCRPLCFIQPCRTSHLPAGLARHLESTEIARRHLQTVSEPAASAWSGSESVPIRKPAELSTATTYMVLHCLAAPGRAIKSSVGATKWATLSSTDRLSSSPYLVGHGFVLLSPPSCRSTSFLLRNGAGTPSWAFHFPFHGLFSHFPANQNSETFVSQIILTISG